MFYVFKHFPGEESTASNQEMQLRLTNSETALAKKSSLLREVSSKVINLERKCSRLEEENHLLRKTHEVKANRNSHILLQISENCEIILSKYLLFTAYCKRSQGKE